uniref:Immunoglobulin V-set domain-containing protein n=1 Tax=Cyprinus carpio TaxID=7962 RepID=A0A8C1NBB0_CYPCA
MTANEADQINLMCNYSTSSYNDAYLYWYKQLQNRSPTFILSEFTVGKGTTKDEFKERFSATLDSTSRTVPLMIKNLHLPPSHHKTLTKHQIKSPKERVNRVPVKMNHKFLKSSSVFRCGIVSLLLQVFVNVTRRLKLLFSCSFIDVLIQFSLILHNIFIGL